MTQSGPLPTDGSPAGARIEMDGMLNLRDLGGWPLRGGGHVTMGRVFRADRLTDLTNDDWQRFEALGVEAVIDLRSHLEVEEDPSRLWPGVRRHHHFAIGGDAAQQKSFIEQIFDGEFDEITDDWVGEQYVEMLQTYGSQFGRAVVAAIDDAPSLFHCTAGKDRTGLTSMMLLAVVGVDDDDILTDFTLSNVYRAEARMAQLAPTFTERGLDIEDYRPALSAPRPAMERAMSWLEREHTTVADYLRGPGGLSAAQVDGIGALLAS